MRSMFVLVIFLSLAGCGDDSGGGAAAAGGGLPITGGMGVTGGTGVTTGGMGVTGGTGVATGGMGVTGGTGVMTGGVGTGGMVLTGGMGAGTAGMGGMGAAGTGGGALELTSTAVMDMGMLPAMYRCVSLFGGPGTEGPSPPLAWTAGATGTMSYTLIFKDTSPMGTLGAGTIHWVIKDIPSSVMALPMGVAVGAMPPDPAGAVQVANGLPTADVGYRGPCGGMNQYTFTLYAINAAALPGATTAAAAETAAMANNVGTATLVVNSMP